MPLLCNVRPILPEDVPDLVEADAHWNQYYDPHLDLQLTPIWSLDATSLLDFIQQYDDGRRQDTRVFTVEKPMPTQGTETDDEAEAETEPEIVGGFGYLIDDDEYYLAFVALKQGAVTEAVAAIADFFRKKITRKKRSVRLVFRDTDKNLRELWPAWRAQNYRIRLLPNYFRGADGTAQDGWQIQSPN